MKMPRDLTACALWVAAIVTFAFGAVDSAREHHNSIILAAGVFLAIVALVPTGWCIAERVANKHHTEVEDIVTIVDGLHHSTDAKQPRSIR